MKTKKPKSRNPIAKNLKVNKPKIIPDKKKLAKNAKLKKNTPEFAKIIPGGTNATYDGM